MKRRDFIFNSGKAALASTFASSLFPFGNVSAAEGDDKIKHVVLIMLGGIRLDESILFNRGNLMPNLLSGNKVASYEIGAQLPTLARLCPDPIQRFGTLFTDVNYSGSVVSHFEAQASILNGNDIGDRSNSLLSKIDKQAEKKAGYAFSMNHFTRFKEYAVAEKTRKAMGKPGDEYDISSDIQVVYEAEKILNELNPQLTVISLNDSDIAHSNYTQHCVSISKIDFALGHLWQSVQFNPSLKNNTLFVILPEHGRNAKSNSISDKNGLFGLDHGNNEWSRKTFCMIAGPAHVVSQNKVVKTAVNTSEINEFISVALALDSGTKKNSSVLFDSLK